jgi:AraC-like DNA-binding protein
MAMSVRVLQQRLEDEQTSFQEIIEIVRKDLATTHLTEKQMQLTQLAYLLGYSEVSAFSRSFKRWYGVSPSVWQKQASMQQ